jgi:hypothetical protein
MTPSTPTILSLCTLTAAACLCTSISTDALPASQTLVLTPGQAGESVEVDPFSQPGTGVNEEFLEYQNWTVDGFEPGLGQLESIQISGTLFFNGVVTTGATGGGLGMGAAVFLTVNDVEIGAGGLGGGTGGPPNATLNAPFQFTLTPEPFTEDLDAAIFGTFLSSPTIDIEIKFEYDLNVSGPASIGSMFRLEDSVIVLTYNYSLPGDTDGDGDVDDADLGTSFANYTGPGGLGKTAENGDTDGDGDVDDADLGTSFASYTGPQSTAVPEPASLALLTLGGMVMARRRRA